MASRAGSLQPPPAMAATLPATPNPATAQFQLAVPSLLATLSPSLAALHATRARRLHPPHVHAALAGTHCARCGYPLLASNSQTRSIRKKRRPGSGPSTPRRLLRMSCGCCGHDEDVPLAVDGAPTFPKVRDRVKRKSSSTTASQPRASGAADPSSAALSFPSPVPVPLIPRSSQPTASPSQSTPMPSRPGSAASARATSREAPSLASSPAPSGGASQAQDQTRTKARPKKKPGLQSMLARNRERQQEEKKRGDSSGQGLSAFLQGL
ncbi:hypothetical protein C8T65DRAFT_736517 [Cerioporus squamosus]|nr:hypothetical protein C8T65DRAFT_736517 [Cerioporus squamosus]